MTASTGSAWQRHWPLLLAAVLLAAYVATTAVQLQQGWDRAARGEVPVFTDYTPLYASSILVQREPAANLFVTERMRWAEIEAAQAVYDQTLSDAQAAAHGFARWQYPPVFILYVHPLAWLPYFPSLLAWLLVTAVPYLAAVRLAAPAGLAWPLALAAPPLYFNLIYGQTGFLTAGYLGLGLAWLERRPWLAGACIGMACFKPHFGLLLPLALLLGGHWRPFVAAALTVVALVAVTLALYGPDPWLAMVATLQYSFDGFALGRYNFDPMTSVIGAVRLAGGSADAGWWAQGVATVAAVALVGWAWRDRDDDRRALRAALLCAASLLVAPLSYLYDLLLLVPAVGWLAADMRRHGCRTWEAMTLIVLLGGTLFHLTLAAAASISVGLLAVVGVLAIATVRLAARRATG